MPIQYPSQNIYTGLHFPVTPLISPQQRDAQESLIESRDALAEERRARLKKLRDDAIEEATITKALQSLPVDTTTGQPDYDQLPNLVLQVGGNLNHIKTAQKFVDDTNKARLDQFKTQNALEKDEVALSVQALQQTNEDGSNWPPVRRQALASISDPKKRAMMEEVVPVEFPGMDGVRTLVQHGESAHDFAARTDALMKEAPLTVEAWKKFLGETMSAPGVPPATIEAAKNLARTYGGKIGKDAAAMMEGVTPEAAAGMAITPEQRAQTATAAAAQTATQGRFDITSAETARHNKAMEAAANLRAARTGQGRAGGSNATDIESVVQGIIDGSLPPDLTGMYSARVPIEAALARKGYNMTRAVEDWKGTQRYLTTLNSTQQVRLRQAIEFTSESLNVIDDLNKQWKAGGFPLLNHAQLVAAKNGVLGTKAAKIATQLETQIADLTSELGTVYKGGYSSTDESLKLAAKNLSADWSQEVLASSVDLVRRNLRIRQNSMRNIGPVGGTTANPYAPQTETPPPAGGGQKVRVKGKDGKTYEFPSQAAADNFKKAGG